GRRQRVQPGSIVGALANEGGFNSSDIGGIDIRSDFSLVELPAELSNDQWRALSKTRIGGELIKLELDSGRRPSRDGDGNRGDFGSRGGRDRDRAPRDGDFGNRGDFGSRGGRGGRDRGGRDGEWGGRGGSRGGFGGSRGGSSGGARRFGGSR
ncbi:DbpA RNA binding domain-containing protein, partial [Sinomonas sp. G460-2]|uniref:DbpA RNA binding domain-containing protein n=1 Tax=Sinomonas sp. G460-2 TaxID=3393464 RepID=UPI0039F06CF5